MDEKLTNTQNGTKIALYNYPVSLTFIQAVAEEFNLKCQYIEEESNDDTQVYIIYGNRLFKKEFRNFLEQRMEEFYEKNK